MNNVSPRNDHRGAVLPILVGLIGITACNGTTKFVALTKASIEQPPRYHRRIGDLWMSTWADDDALYMTFGDGIGRGDCCVEVPQGNIGEPGCDPIPSSIPIDEVFDPSGGTTVCADTSNYCRCEATDFGLSVLKQDPAAEPQDCGKDCLIGLHIPDHVAIGTPGERNDKPSSILSVDGTLYLAGHSPAGDPDFGWLASSGDHGATWDETPSSPWQRPSPYRVLMFIQMGKDYGLNTDGYVYALGMGAEIGWGDGSGQPGKIYLARVSKHEVADYSAWEYLDGVHDGEPSWTSSATAAVPVEGLGSWLQGSSIYHPETGSYLFMCNNDPGGLYQAEHPWGPWKKISDLFVPGELPAGWLDWGPVIGMIPMDTGRHQVLFTTSSDAHYALTIGTVTLE